MREETVMPTGACGINCDTCRLNLLGICTTCGSGISVEGQRKMAAQQRLLGAPCPILDCAVTNRIAYCPRDCSRFPCENFRNGPYPFSQAWLDMQTRRRQSSQKISPEQPDTLPEAFWTDLAAADTRAVAGRTCARIDALDKLVLPFLDTRLRICPATRSVMRLAEEGWRPEPDALVQLMAFAYLRHASDADLAGVRVGVSDLRSAAFFKGPHVLPTAMLADRFGADPEGFARAAGRLGGVSVPLADQAFRFLPFPKVPFYFLLWTADPEFPAQVTVLFDRSIEAHLPADAIWATVTLVARRLVQSA
jgi:hypothetical protein